ncbi:hypothetical protein CsSME_00011094 [Camellia sinensis var. sinensis]
MLSVMGNDDDSIGNNDSEVDTSEFQSNVEDGRIVVASRQSRELLVWQILSLAFDAMPRKLCWWCHWRVETSFLSYIGSKASYMKKFTFYIYAF